MKCAFCNRQIVRQTPYSGEFVEYDGKFWHPACLIHKRTAKGTRKDKWPDDSQIIVEKLGALRKQTQEKIQAVQDKEKLYQYLTTQYGAYFLPKQFFMRLDQVFDGIFPGLYVAISPAELLSFWREQQNYLNEKAAQYPQNVLEDPLRHLSYDLAILLSQYNKHLREKRRNDAENAITAEQYRQYMADTKAASQIIMSKSASQIEDMDENRDLSDVLGTLFDDM